MRPWVVRRLLRLACAVAWVWVSPSTAHLVRDEGYTRDERDALRALWRDRVVRS